MKKKIIFCGGGTGGHIFPSISLYNFFITKNYEVMILTDKRGVKFFKKESLSHKIIDIDPYRSGIKNKINFSIKLLKVFISSYLYLKSEKPNIIFGLGGYVSFPICLAAKLLNIKIVLYESNSVIGRVNKFFIGYCEKLFTNSEKIINIPKKYSTKCFKVGNIVREEILKYKIIKKNYLDSTKTIIVLGGSQGAKIFGDIVPKVILNVATKYEVNIIQQSIPEQVDIIKNVYDKNKIKNNVFSFNQNIFELMSKADLAISRCGSSTLGELEFLGIPFIAVPYPFAKDNHQYQNAIYYKEKGCCWLLNQKNFTFSVLKELLVKILDNKFDLSLKRETMLNNVSENSLAKIEKQIRKLI